MRILMFLAKGHSKTFPGKNQREYDLQNVIGLTFQVEWRNIESDYRTTIQNISDKCDMAAGVGKYSFCSHNNKN